MSDANVWAQLLERLKVDIDPEEYRRWFSTSSYASDSGDVITVWVPSAADGRQISQNHMERLRRELARLGRSDTLIRFVATGYSDEEDEEEKED
jgi:chromosomal replication initiation ATPase DnaA